MEKYYNNLISIWNNGGGWGGIYYGVFSKIINDNNLKIVAEVGIGYGFHAKEILDNTNIKQLYLVDPMEMYESEKYGGFAYDVETHGGFEELVKQIKNHLKSYENKYTWYRKPSISISNSEILDGSLDAVFLDAEHTYEAVINDLPFWWSKLKIGGYLLGDDYILPGVKQAVDEFAKNNNLELNFLYKENSNIPDYKIFQFKK
jgi:predicted O-methyltransferase YrrM